MSENLYVCPKCTHHLRVSARHRIEMIADAGSFVERDADMVSSDVLSFPDYDQKLAKATADSQEKEAVITGTAKINDYPCAIFVMEARFMMGSMGSVVGEKLTRLFEYATRERLSVVGFTLSGGARMQEGIYSLMQMAKVSGAVERHDRAGLFYLVMLTDPTTGGVTASFAMQGDIILAEPNALIGFAGPRVIEQTIRKRLPEGFQRAELLQEKGFVEHIVQRSEQRDVIARLLRMHAGGKSDASV